MGTNVHVLGSWQLMESTNQDATSMAGIAEVGGGWKPPHRCARAPRALGDDLEGSDLATLALSTSKVRVAEARQVESSFLGGVAGSWLGSEAMFFDGISKKRMLFFEVGEIHLF